MCQSLSLRHIALPLFVAFVLPSCDAPEPPPPEAARSPTALTRAVLVGTWRMETITEQGADVNAEHNPAGNRWMRLDADGTFESGGDPYGHNTGRWSYDPATRELFLDSDAGEGDDSYWTLSLDAPGILRLRGTRSDFTERFEMTMRREPCRWMEGSVTP